MKRSASLQLLLSSLFLGLNLATTSDGDGPFTYTGFAGANLSLDGMATVTPSGLLRLTDGNGQDKGHAFHPDPLRFRKAPGGAVQSFSVSFVFAILSIYPNLSSQGMAFLVCPTKNLSATGTRGLLGIFNRQSNGNASNHIFAVELDTIQNSEFQDINDNHIGIDVNSILSAESYYTGYYEDSQGDFRNITLNSHEAMKVWVDYDEETTKISVTIAPLKMSKPIRPLLSTTYNLSIVLTDEAYVGFSSTTGNIDSQHYVLGWSFGMNQPAPAIDVTKLPKLPGEGPKKHSSMLMETFLPIATGIFVLAIGVAILQFMRRRSRFAELREDWEIEFGPHRFSYKDLFRATQGFKDKYLLGVGGFGRVYRGVLPSSKLEVAVKRVSHDSRQGMKEFIAEVVSIGRLRHRNLVPLLGYCRRRGELLLVYEYMSNGSLDKYLYEQDGKPSLNWVHRFHIIKGIASGVLYLHEEWDQVVIHRDIKASNVLLDAEMNARLGDFGLAKLYDHGIDPQTTHVVGTMGYLAPELARTGRASPLTDVFAFGVFLLEVTCGRRPVEQTKQVDNGVSMLVDWVLEQWHKGLLARAVDPRLQDEFDTHQTSLVLKLGLLCSHPVPDARPSMRQVMQYLDGDMKLPELMPESLSFGIQALLPSEGFDSHIMSHASTLSDGAFTGISGGR
ncbi:L-type lectin-domain containing receptor kinase SIT2-like [Phragmites australis]|uniref:L-type lectin-domain containing receptor kinase SIT2-like n=1 Tax=Phragmites australis TaxID=29695 RepID=UPI002D7A1BB7|nr:L-type lectin-domain containing receptor kinase SIT2-like [Phragmites australis]